MTHLAIAAMASFIFTFGATEISYSPEVIKVSVRTSDCTEAKPQSKPAALELPLSNSAVQPNSDVICGSVSLDDQEQPRCNLQLIA